MEEKNQNTEEKKDLTQEEIEDVQGGSVHHYGESMEGQKVFGKAVEVFETFA